MKHITAFLITAIFAAGVEAKPLKVFILAGQSNMEGHAKIETFDYIGDDPATAPIWSDELGAIAEKRDQLDQMRHFLDSKHKDHPNADDQMTDAQKQEYLKEFEAKLISPAEVALWKRGASNAGYHYLGCAKTFALMGKGFAEANIEMMKQQRRP